MERIIVKSFPDGQVEIKTQGFVGAACKSATSALEKALGGKVLSDTPTAEMHDPQKATNRAQY